MQLQNPRYLGQIFLVSRLFWRKTTEIRPNLSKTIHFCSTMRVAVKLASSMIKASTSVLRKPTSIGIGCNRLLNRCVSHFVFSPESSDPSLGMYKSKECSSVLDYVYMHHLGDVCILILTAWSKYHFLINLFWVIFLWFEVVFRQQVPTTTLG